MLQNLYNGFKEVNIEGVSEALERTKPKLEELKGNAFTIEYENQRKINLI